MLELINKTPFSAIYSPLTNQQGIDELVVFVCASLQLKQGRWQLCDSQMPSPLADDYWNPDQPSSIRYPSQLAFAKPATDIIINGAAVAPNGQSVKALQASVEVGNCKACVDVFGERVWHGDRISAVQTFERMPLIWENAFGGSVILDSQQQTYEYNPLGKGWLPDKTAAHHFNGLELPNIEWPHARIQSVNDKPSPAGFGSLAAENPQRSQFAGSYDQHWQQTRAPFVPCDFNPRFFNSAILPLQYPGFIQGSEPVRLINLNSAGEQVFQLPQIRLGGQVTTHDGRHPLTFVCNTLLIESETTTLRFFYQATAPIIRTLAEILDIQVHLARTL